MPESVASAATPHVHAARVALVGDRSPSVRSHARVPFIFESLQEHYALRLDAYWIRTRAVAKGGLEDFDAIWLMPGSPYASEDGALTAVATARERRIPFLGTCAGFHHAVLQFARDTCGLDVGHADNEPDCVAPLIVPLKRPLLGHQRIVSIQQKSLTHQLLAASSVTERYNCSYGLSRNYVRDLRDHGLRASGTSENGEVQIVELVDHPFFVATLFQPELASDERQVHPIIRGLAVAAVEHARAPKRLAS
ncbi:hypothetical protein OIU91_10330 [Streptomyces sp. NBC_01456]|uniref:CTP synthase C-terminal region-related (seleno)protein n=1 Tax=unclassified Streptomyces TaxID=2593676 RepID=UPI002E2F471A|nr:MULTISPECIES: hypothetical protein [unclassified Streptomyces]